MEEKRKEIIQNENVYIPRYSEADFRSRDRESVQYDNNGCLKSIYLEGIQQLHTSIGTLPAELVTFYPNGQIHRLFPVFGKLTGYWSETDEEELNTPISFQIEGREYTIKCSCICFYETGSLKSITFWPGQKMEVMIENIKYQIRIGISFFEDGKIESVEPYMPIVVRNQYGTFLAYDNMANGVSGDKNSMRFNQKGEIVFLKSMQTGLELIDKKERKRVISPRKIKDYIEFDQETILPASYCFEDGLKITLDTGETETIDFNKYQVKTIILYLGETGTCGDCKNCNACKGH